MSTFKEIIAQDAANTFLNDVEFADTRYLDGTAMPVLDDADDLEQRQFSGADHQDGLYGNRRLIYVLAANMDGRPKIGSLLKYGKTADKMLSYIVTNVTGDENIYAIEMERNTAR
jgi:hypothetical protein